MAYPPAYMGFVGFVRFRPAGDNFIVRATSADMNLTQDISMPDVVDSRYDRTVYQLGPKEIEGTIEFPVIYDNQGNMTVVRRLYDLAVNRNVNTGGLDELDIDVRYSPSDPQAIADLNYLGCIVNNWEFSVSQSDNVNISTNVIGKERVEPGLNGFDAAQFNDFNFYDQSTQSDTSLENTRVVTWNDARVEAYLARDWSEPILGSWIRTFNVSINNNAERFYTLNGKLFPQAIAPTKRDIEGSFEVMGRHKGLSSVARTNEFQTYEQSYINFGFAFMGAPVFQVKLPNIVFRIEEMSLSNDIFVTTVNWNSLPAAGTSTLFGDPLAYENASDGWEFSY